MPSALLVDTPSTSLHVSDADLHAWGNGRRIFVSSLIDLMKAERTAVRAAILEVGAVPVMFEYDLGGQDIAAQLAYLDGVRSSSVYIGLFGPIYGIPLPSGDSATEEEFLEAERQNLRLVAFVQLDASDPYEGRQARFVQGLRNKLTTGGWRSPEDLQLSIRNRLADLAAEEIAPWVKLDDVAIRATRIRASDDSITVTASVRRNEIRARIESWRNQRRELTVVMPGRVATGRVTSVQSDQTSNASTTYEVTVLVADASQPSWTRMSLNSNGHQYSADDLVRFALEDSLFATSNSPRFAGPPVRDVLGPLRGIQLAEAAARPLIELLITEYLIGTGSARIIDGVTVGPNNRGNRHVTVTWSPPQTDTNMPAPVPITIDGEISDLRT